MVIKVGINGFGRIGRVVFRACFQNNKIVLTAINDPAIDIDYICYLIKFDSTHGKFKKKVTCIDDGAISIDDQCVKIFREKSPREVPWHLADVHYVIEASGMFTSLEKAKGHMASDGVRRVIVTAPSIDVPMLILGVNNDQISTENKVLSCASSTLYCLAPIIKILSDKFGVESGFMTSIHAMTPSLKPLDGLCLRGKHWRDNRSIHQNIIPAKTGACKALGKIIPQVKDKIIGLAFRVPIVNVSVLDITIRLDTNTTIQEVIDSVEYASKTGLRNIITVSNEDAVSSDFIGDQHSCILDVDSTIQLNPNFMKLVCWYENEYSYACRVIDTILFSEKQFCISSLVSKTTFVRSRPSRKHDELLKTEYNSREKSVECNCEGAVPKVINSTSNFKLKLSNKKQRSYLRKSLYPRHSESATLQSFSNRDIKKRSDLFKIWSDGNGNTVLKNSKPDTDAKFYSCTAFHNLDEINKPLNPKEHLEKVKKEFSKMLDITENLLKKTYTKNLHIERTEKIREPREGIDIELGDSVSLVADFKNNKENVNKQEKKVATFRECGDFDGSKNINNKKTEKRKVPRFYLIDLHKEGNSQDRDTQIHNDPKNENIEDDLGGSSLTNFSTPNIVDENASDYLYKSEIALNNSTEHVKNKCEKSCEDISFNTKHTNHKSSEKYDIDGDGIDVTDTPNHALTSQKSIMISPVRSSTIDLKNNTEYRMLILDEELKKRNMILLNLERNADLFDIDSGPAIIKANGIELIKTSEEGVPTGFANFLNHAEHALLNDDLSRSGSGHNTETTISNGERKAHKQDLYDKLDSASASDSDNSFQIHERKSQVIQITDLTNSIEDVSRLDKICKIIEISDELSDELFSKLDKVENILNQNGKWSFNELCKRIQLDEFCNKVFNNSGA